MKLNEEEEMRRGSNVFALGVVAVQRADEDDAQREQAEELSCGG